MCLSLLRSPFRFSFARACIVIASIGLLSACVFRDRSEDYRRSGSIDPIVVPENMQKAPLDPLYPIPEVVLRDDTFYDAEEVGYDIPRPEPMSAEAEQTRVKIQRVGSQRWIVLEAPPSQVWPLAQSFLARNGVLVSRSQPATGLIETDWLGLKEDPVNKSRFQVRIEKGVRPEVTEVHVLHQQVPENQFPTNWPAQSDDKAREAWLLDAMGTSLADDIRNKAASLLGQSVGGEVKAKLAVAQDEPALILNLSMMRAWATVAQALKKEGMTIWGERDADNLFYVQYLPEDDEPGWVKKILYPKSQLPTREAPFTIDQVIQNLSNETPVRNLFAHIDAASFTNVSDQKMPRARDLGYLVVLKQHEGEVIVRIRDHRGRLLDSQKNRQLLVVIRRNLI